MTTSRPFLFPLLACLAFVARLAFGTVLIAGCASFAKNDTPALASAGPLRARPAVASGDELEARSLAANPAPRERAVAQRVTLKSFKSIDWLPKASSQDGAEEQEGVGEIGKPSLIAGAAPAVGPARAPAFGERRASEALDRLEASVTIRREKRGAVITLASDRLADSGEWTLTASGRYSLRELAAGLRDQDGRAIRIEGYTDSMGTPAVNDALSLRRAEAVRDFLITQGVGAESMRAEGMGAKRPVGRNDTSEGRAQNRRIEIVISPLE